VGGLLAFKRLWPYPISPPPPTFAPMINYHDRRFVQMANHLHDLQLR